MNIKLTAKNMIITPGITNRIEKKTKKMERYIPDDSSVYVHLTKENATTRKVEITVHIKGSILRAESYSDENLFLAIDSALAKIERQIHKHKTKLSNKVRKESFNPEYYEYIDEEVNEEQRVIEKRKSYPIKPMSIEDAILNMELLGHTFYVYVDIDTNNTNVLYLRKNGTLGILEPEN